MRRLYTIGAHGLRPLVVPVYKIGRAVKYHGDIANPSGIGAIVAIRQGSESSPLSYDVALTDGRQILGTFLDGSRWTVAEDHVAPDAVEILRAGVVAKEAADKAKKSAADEHFAQTIERLRKDYQHLSQGAGPVTAAKNLRTELKRAFPGVAFRVRTSQYSGGNSVDVSWTDGPNSQQVEALAKKYQGGHFDGMTDCYEYKRSPWPEVFGEAKYVFCSREYSDKMLQSVIARVCERLGGMEERPAPSDYRMGHLWKFKQSGGCDVEREIRQALQKHTYCIAKAGA